MTKFSEKTKFLKRFTIAFLILHTNSHQRCCMKKCVLRNFIKITGKHLCQSLFFNEVAGLRPVTFIKRDSGTGVFL